MNNPNINTSERLFDLVRYMRSELHEGGLITDQEYAWLCAGDPMATSPTVGSPSAQRLEEYGEMVDRIKQLESEIFDLKKPKLHPFAQAVLDGRVEGISMWQLEELTDGHMFNPIK